MHAIEAERNARSLAIERQIRHAVAGGRTERVLLHTPQHGLQTVAVVANLRGEPLRPERDGARHGGLHVRVARQGDRSLLRGDALEPRDHGVGAGRELADRVAQVQAQGDQHLVVARAAEMHAATGRADALREPPFERAVHVLVRELDGPLARGVSGRERIEAGADRVAVGVAQQALLRKHARVGDRRARVIGHEPFVEDVILAGREFQDALVER